MEVGAWAGAGAMEVIVGMAGMMGAVVIGVMVETVGVVGMDESEFLMK